MAQITLFLDARLLEAPFEFLKLVVYVGEKKFFIFYYNFFKEKIVNFILLILYLLVSLVCYDVILFIMFLIDNSLDF